MSERLKIFLGYVLITLVWGSTWLVIRIGLDSLSPMLAVGLRSLTASFFIFFIMKFAKIKLPMDSFSIKLYLLLAFFSFILPQSLVYWAEQFVPSGLTSVIFSSFPFFVILFSWILTTGEQIGRYKISGSIIAFIGITIIFWEDFSLDFSLYSIGIIAILLSAGIQGFASVVIKKHGNYLHPLSINFIPLLLAGIVLIPFGLFFEDQTNVVLNAKSIYSILYLAVLSNVVSFTVYYWLMKKISVVLLSLSSFITPIIALILGVIILDERITYYHIMGSSLVLIGILFANFKGLIKYYNERENKKID